MENIEYRKYLKEIRYKITSVNLEDVISKLEKDKVNLKMTQTTLILFNKTIKYLKGKRKTKTKEQTESSGERKIRKYLRDKGINFIQEKEFLDLINPKTNCKLRFDFYLPDFNIVIEFDGKQHFEQTEKFDKTKKDFKSRVYRDELKNKYCKSKNIKLIRISYKDYYIVDDILQKEIK